MNDNTLQVSRPGLWLLMVALVLLVLNSCTATRPRPEQLPSLVGTVHPDSLASLPAYLVPAPAGSTPRQQRQWQRAQTRNLARAGLQPATVKLKHSAVATGAGSTAVSTAKNTSTAVGPGATATQVADARAPVATGSGPAQDFTKAAKRGGALATAPGASAAATTRTGISPWALVVGLLVLLLLGLAVLAYRCREQLGGWLKIGV